MTTIVKLMEACEGPYLVEMRDDEDTRWEFCGRHESLREAVKHAEGLHNTAAWRISSERRSEVWYMHLKKDFGPFMVQVLEGGKLWRDMYEAATLCDALRFARARSRGHKWQINNRDGRNIASWERDL